MVSTMTGSDSSDVGSLNIDCPAEEFFSDVVSTAVEARGLTTSRDSQVYLVALLADHARRPTLHHVDEPFGVRLARAMHASGGERFERLRTLGDDVLFISGFYSDYLEHRGLPLDYVSGLGRVAYGGVADILRRHAGKTPIVFEELADGFAGYVALLQHVSDSLIAEALRDESEVLGIYERWARTGSAVLADALIRFGLAPQKGSKSGGLN